MTARATLGRHSRPPVALIVLAMLVACNASENGSPSAPSPAPTGSGDVVVPHIEGPAVVVAAGDIACDTAESEPGACHQAATADRVVAIDPDAVLVLGDAQYEHGDLEDFERYYGPTWGRFRDITFPAPGNHEYETPGAQGYFDYFGPRAPGPFYSFDLGPWHAISLNTEIGMDEGSEQVRWLLEDLTSSQASCTLAFWHRPRFSSGTRHGDFSPAQPLWQALAEAGADLVLTGHEHLYERFAQLNSGGTPGESGLRQFTAGTGGKDLYELGAPIKGSEARDNAHFGVLQLTLDDDGYDWAFVAEDGTVVDSGADACV
jgi:hypothetical protein